MTHKTGIVAHLGEDSLLLPRAVNEALAANDRVKYYFSLLQAARDHAEAPHLAAPDLVAERQAAGVDDPAWDTVPGGTVRLEGRGAGPVYRIPLAERLQRAIGDEIRTMLAPLEQAGTDAAPAQARRLETLLAEAPDPAGGQVPGSWIRRATSGRRDEGDSLHLLVMDLHKQLNALQAGIATESVRGATAYGLEERDRPRVEAFMAGVERTAPLKFDHPGLATTATRSGPRLVIQNDIGTTDAHVLVVHVEDLAATVTYTDVHLERARFFQGQFDGLPVHWQDLTSRRVEGLEESDHYFLCLGTLRATGEDELDRFLGHLGSRLVFLIDWNKARKRLRNFVRKRDAIALLDEAARREYGHRGFLELGGESLLYAALEDAARGPLRYGEPLHEILGREAARSFLAFVLRTASEGLREGRSSRLIRDQVRAELANYFETAEEHLLALACRHAALVVEIATAIHDALLHAPGEAGAEERRRVAERAEVWEKRADALLVEVRSLVRRTTGTAPYRSIVEAADDGADGLEEAAFLLSLLPGDAEPELLRPLQELAELVLEGARELVKTVESARAVDGAAARADVDDFLAGVDRLVTLEHRTDEANRRVFAAALQRAADFRQLHLWSELARALEEATDSLARCGLLLRDHVLEEVSGRETAR